MPISSGGLSWSSLRVTGGWIGSILPNHFNQGQAAEVFRGARVYAAEDGIVEIAGWESDQNHKLGYGFRVKLRVEDGSMFVYAHIDPDSLVVQKGDRLVKSQLIGSYANPSNGGSSGPHLHFEWRGKGGEVLDPQVYLSVVIPNHLQTDKIGFRSKHPVTGQPRMHKGYDLLGPLK